jgi:hypothetical protein
MAELFPIPLAEQIREVQREIAMRERLYPGWVKNGQLSRHDAARNIARMQAVLKTLQSLVPQERRDGQGTA